MKCEICEREFKELETIYRLRTLKQTPRGGDTSIVLIDACKECATFVIQVDEQGVQLKRNDKRRIKAND
jgi:hypothetical protein